MHSVIRISLKRYTQYGEAEPEYQPSIVGLLQPVEPKEKRDGVLEWRKEWALKVSRQI
jgi:hypothetical protein